MNCSCFRQNIIQNNLKSKKIYRGSITYCFLPLVSQTTVALSHMVTQDTTESIADSIREKSGKTRYKSIARISPTID